MDWKNLMNDNDSLKYLSTERGWTAYLIERCLDSDTGVSEDAYGAMHKVADTMPECPAREYIEKMLYRANSTYGLFCLKDDFDMLFGSEFMKNWSVK